MFGMISVCVCLCREYINIIDLTDSTSDQGDSDHEVDKTNSCDSSTRYRYDK